MKYEFDTIEEFQEAMKNLSAYHNCEKCRGKIICIQHDLLGNTCCGYCHKQVKYPIMNKEKFKEWIKKETFIKLKTIDNKETNNGM